MPHTPDFAAPPVPTPSPQRTHGAALLLAAGCVLLLAAVATGRAFKTWRANAQAQLQAVRTYARPR